MHDRLKDKVIVVAGAGGIGNELARRYAAEGARVVVGDAKGDAARALAEDIAASGGQAIGTGFDGADDASIKGLVDLATSAFGGLDGFHANYACFADGAVSTDVLGLSLDVYDQMMQVNARGFLLCTRHALPAMLARGGGSMVYTSSGAAHSGDAVRVAYGMSKAAIHALMRHVARAFGPQGIRANVIAPGVITHAKHYEIMSPEMIEGFKRGTLFKNRLGAPVDIAALGALLMADEGSFITGQVLSVDGGASMRP